MRPVFEVISLSEADAELRASARQFCLSVIEDVYGISYRADWHADLDSLCLSSRDNWYAPENRGAFRICLAPGGHILATCGIYSMAWKRAGLRRLAAAYPASCYGAAEAGDGGASICQLSRMYVRSDLRGQGIGTLLQAAAFSDAFALGYNHIYLHADARSQGACAFWNASGYECLGQDDDLMVMDFTRPVPAR